MPTLSDSFDGTAGVLAGRVATTGQVWSDNNDTLRLDGSGRLIRNPTSEGGTTGSYGQVTIDATPTVMYADISFGGTSSIITENGAVVLISGDSSARNGNPPTQGIFHRAIHAVFGAWQTAVSIWENDAAVLPNIITYTYPGGKLALDGTVYRIAMWFDGQRLRVQMPDGAIRYAADSRVQSYIGPNLIYQVYNVTAPNLRPKIEAAYADTTPVSFAVSGVPESPY